MIRDPFGILGNPYKTRMFSNPLCTTLSQYSNTIWNKKYGIDSSIELPYALRHLFLCLSSIYARPRYFTTNRWFSFYKDFICLSVTGFRLRVEGLPFSTQSVCAVFHFCLYPFIDTEDLPITSASQSFPFVGLDKPFNHL